MQRIQRKQLTTAIVTLLLTTPLWATNGYFTHGTGTKNKAMAGSGLAMPEDAISIANNPAAAIAGAGKYDLGIAVFSPLRHYETGPSYANGQCAPSGGCAFTIGPNDMDSDNNYHYIPHMAGAWKINDESAWGAVFYGKGGMNTEWKSGTATSGFFSAPGEDPATYPGTYGAGIFGGNGGAGVDFSQAFLEFSYARSAGDRFTYGASLVGVMQVFAARGVGTFGAWTESAALGEMPDSLSNNGHEQSYGLGVKVGLGWELTDQFSFAVAYQPKIGMSKLKDYSDLFADGGNMDIPADLKLGLTYRPNPGLALNFDYERIWYNDVVSVGNPFSNLFMCNQVNPMGSSDYCMGGKNGPGFGWENMDVFKIGAQWSSGNDWTWRAGFSHGDQPIPESEMVFNILAPGVIEDHATFGFTRKLASGDEFNMSFMYAFKETISGPNPLDNPDPAFAQTVSLDMSQWEIEFSYGWR